MTGAQPKSDALLQTHIRVKTMKHLLRSLILMLTAGLAFAGSPKISKDLEGKKAGDTVDVIVQFREAPTEKHHEKLKKKRGRLKEELELVQGGVYSIPADALDSLADDPDVVYISPDRPVQGMLDYATTAVGADTARNLGYDGKGVGVAVIDSGISDHSDLKISGQFTSSRVVYSATFVGGNSSDEYGHGTHVAGIIGGNGSSSTGMFFTTTFRGVAPNVNLINLRVLDKNGAGTDSGVINAINSAIKLKTKYNIRILNLSLGRPVFESYKAWLLRW